MCSWAGLTPQHRESDTTIHRGSITKQGPPIGALGRHRGRVGDQITSLDEVIIATFFVSDAIRLRPEELLASGSDVCSLTRDHGYGGAHERCWISMTRVCNRHWRRVGLFAGGHPRHRARWPK
ncbi:MAG TPA: hypothetical protein VLG28_08640 [Acidimicrobiia bacterium]|nr:hypothetical protein [Acidimicrobiia bacterium]